MAGSMSVGSMEEGSGRREAMVKDVTSRSERNDEKWNGGIEI